MDMKPMYTLGKSAVRKATLLSTAAFVGGGLALLPLTQAVAQSLPNGMSAAGSADLRSVVQQTITQNPEVKAAFQAFSAAGFDTDEARGGFLPTLDATAGIGRESVEGDGRGSFDSDFVQLELNQMVFDGFATANEVERLNKARLVRYYELLDASEQVALEAARAYADVKRHRELVRLAQDNYAEHLRVYNQIEERALSGAGRGVDLEQISGRLALAESNLMTEASNLHDVSARYKRIVGDLPAETLEQAPEMAGFLPPSVTDAVNLAFEGNPEFHAAIENIDAARAQQDVTRSGFQPRMDIVGRAGTNNNSDAGLQGRRDEQSIELVASVNLFRGGSDLASFRAASERIDLAVNERELICHNIRQTTQIAYNDTQRLREQMEYLNQHRQSIDRVRGAYQQQFDIGERTLLDVLDSENEYFEASRAYVNAEYDVLIADARTLASMGQLLQTLEVANSDIPSLSDLNSQGVNIDPETVCPVEGPEGFTLADLVGDVTAQPTRAPDAILSADALFAIDSAVLSAEARSELMQLVDQIRGREDLGRIYIAGHADTTGNDAINEPLSRRRAESVANFLIQQGVNGSLIQTEGFGSRQPVASNDTAQGRRQNRRVEVTLETLGELGDYMVTDTRSAQPVPTLSAEQQQGSLNASYAGSTSSRQQPAQTMRQTANQSTANFYLQVMALSNEESARELQRSLQQRVDGSVRVVNGGGFFRVQVGTNGNPMELRRQLDSLGYYDAFPVSS
ncbi:TolC family outer membrane protein [Vreelandella azerica]|nr:TolC family outer membrane protein [Halomonas azerica]